MIVVIGSSNTDMVIKTERLPRAGETVCGGTFIMAPGGKGANQAVACAKLGVSTYFIGRIGKDIFGDISLRNLQAEGVLCDFVVRDTENHSGIALIIVDEAGENTIAVAPGANSKLSPEDVELALSKIETQQQKPQALVLQLEVPIETVERSIQIAKSKQITVILNPAPAKQLPAYILNQVDYLIPNEHELNMLTETAMPPAAECSNLEGYETSAKKLLAQKTTNLQAIVLTLGASGALIVNKDRTSYHIPAPKVEAVDTTAAGDAFVGAFTVALTKGNSLIETVKFANYAAAVSVTRLGAQPSLPNLKEVLEFQKQVEHLEKAQPA